jgi:hypothetical protein
LTWIETFPLNIATGLPVAHGCMLQLQQMIAPRAVIPDRINKHASNLGMIRALVLAFSSIHNAASQSNI